MAGICAAETTSAIWSRLGLCISRADVGWIHATRINHGSDVDE
jgi:hypothetical protein